MINCPLIHNFTSAVNASVIMIIRNVHSERSKPMIL